MSSVSEKRNEIDVLNKKIKNIQVAMLTTVDEVSGSLRSRPMVTQEMDAGGNLWFFTKASAPKVTEAKDSEVNLSYAAPEDNLYVSISGTAQLVRGDTQKVKALWKPVHKIWFQEGKDDPDLALLKVTVSKAEYWDSSTNKMVLLFQAVKAFTTGQQTTGANEKFQLH